MDQSLARLLASVFVVVPVMLVLYRSIVPYELAIRDRLLAGSMLFSLIAGAALGVAHLVLDYGLILANFGLLTFLLLYPAIESYAIVIVHNRRLFLDEPSAPAYFGVGGAVLGAGLAFAELTWVFSSPNAASSDAVLLVSMFLLALAYCGLHASKGLVIGTHLVEGRTLRGVLLSILLQAPFGLSLLVITANQGIATGEFIALAIISAALVYAWTWGVYFPRNMPSSMQRAISRERKRIRRKLRAQAVRGRK